MGVSAAENCVRALTGVSSPHPNPCILIHWVQRDLIEIQPTRSTRFAPPRRVVVTAFVCLALLALLAFAQVAHSHATQAEADHCPLCVVLHTAAPVIAAAPALIIVFVCSLVLVPETRPAIRAWHPKLFTRPPPSSC